LGINFLLKIRKIYWGHIKGSEGFFLNLDIIFGGLFINEIHEARARRARAFGGFLVGEIREAQARGA